MSGSQTITTTIAGPLTIAGGLVSITNAGGVTAPTHGVTLSAGSLVNAGLVSGGSSGLLASGGYVFNIAGGRIEGGTTGYAVSFASGGVLVVNPGAAFVGTVKGDGSLSQLRFGGTGAGTVAGLGTQFVGFQTIEVAAARWTAAGANSIAAGQTVLAYSTFISVGTMINAGTLDAASGGTGVGVYFEGGSLANSGVLEGFTNGLRAPDGLGGTVINSGTITNTSGIGTGASLYDATLDNQVLGTVSGFIGVQLGASAALVNDALVSGSNEGIYSVGGAVTNEAGAVITGGRFGLSGYGSFVNAGTIGATMSSGYAVSLAGTRDSLLVVDPGAAFVGKVDGGNPVGSSYVSTLEFRPGSGTLAGFGSAVTGFGQISLDPGAQWLLAGAASGFGGGETISGFAPGSTIELTGTTESYGTLAGGVLTLSGGTTLALPGAAHANVTASGGDTFITACFATGTRITTPSGPVAVEMLKAGDLVLAAAGRLAPVRWIGRRLVDLARHPRPADIMPVRVRRGAFGGCLPWRDLVLSPDHAVLVRGALIPIRHLVNGASIVQEPRAAVTYWHVELDRHDVILAEGLACESYLDTGNRSAFDNAPGAVAMTPCFARGVWAREGCAEVFTDMAEPRLRAEHTRLLACAWQAGDEALALRRA